MSTFRLPDLGEGLPEAEIVGWHVNEGDHVTLDQPLLAVETDKAVVEVPSPRSGRVAKLLVAAGDIVKVGEPLLTFDGGASEDKGAIVGDLQRQAPEVKSGKPTRSADPADKTPKAAPAVRQLARSLSVDLAMVTPTGPGDAILSEDVRRAAAGRGASVRTEPLRGPRRAMAVRMSEAGHRVVPATVHDEADIGAWPDLDRVLLRTVRAVVAGAAAEPALNAWYLEARQERELFSTVNLGLAVDTPDGLLVPVIEDAGSLSMDELRVRIAALVQAVRDRTIAPTSLRGATVSLSNYGAIAGRYANLVVVPPQVAILGMGRVRNRLLPLSLSFDHRVVTGGEAARFLAAVIADLEKNQ